MSPRYPVPAILTALFLVGVTAASTACAQEGGLVYVSNVTGTSEGGTPLTTIEEQAKRTLDRLGEELGRRGLDYGDVVVSNVFLKDSRHFQAMNEIYRGYFPTDPPTRATVEADLPDPSALIQISVIATDGAKEVITPSGMRSPALPYSWGVRVGSTLFIAGATSRSPETYEPVTGDPETQTRRVLGNVGLVLEEAGMHYGDLVTCRVFLDDPRQFAAMNQAYGEIMPSDDPPARATVRAGLMNPVFDTEIQCIAESSPNRRVVVAEGRERSQLPYSPAISTGERLYLAGMVGSQPGESMPHDAAEQTRNTLENLRETLSAADLGFADVVDTWVYVADLREWEAVREVLEEVLPPTARPGTVIGTPLMGSTARVEIQMVAAPGR